MAAESDPVLTATKIMGVVGDVPSKKRKRRNDESFAETEEASENDTPSKKVKKSKKEKRLSAADESANGSVLLVENTQNVSVISIDDTPLKNGKKSKKDKKTPEVKVDASPGKTILKKEKKRKISLDVEEDNEDTENDKEKKKKRKTSLGVEEDNEDTENDKEKKKKRKTSLGVEEDNEDTENDKKKKKKRKSSSGVEVVTSEQPRTSKTEKLICSVLAYLQQWKESSATWKFNPYYDSCLLNYVTNPAIINEEHLKTFFQFFEKSSDDVKRKNKWKKKLKWNADNVIGENSGTTTDTGMSSKRGETNDDSILFVKNLPFGQTREDIQKGLKEIFPKAKEIRIPFRKKAKIISFAFVVFAKPSLVTSAMAKKQGVSMDGRQLVLDTVGSNNRKKSKSPEHVTSESERTSRAKKILEMLEGPSLLPKVSK